MRAAALTSCALAVALLFVEIAPAAAREGWLFPKTQDAYLMEDDLVSARFLRLARGGDYQQINRDSRGGAEVDRGHWEQDADGTLRLHSTCRALRPRALRGGPLWVTIVNREQRDSLPGVVASITRLLGEYSDEVFAAANVTELNAQAAAEIYLEHGAGTFGRTDALALRTRIAEALESERTGIYALKPLKDTRLPSFALTWSAFSEGDLATVRRGYRAGSAGTTPFYFVQIGAPTYAREVGKWQPLHLPGAAE